jgi:hypothetical protein
MEPVFHLFPQNSPREVAPSGFNMSGRTGTPADRRASASMWKLPKCSIRITPIAPHQPASIG